MKRLSRLGLLNMSPGILVALFIGAATPCAAQSETLPVVKDIPLGEGMGDRKIDIIGIQFGETRENTLAILEKAYPGAKIRPVSTTLSLKDQRGNKVEVDYQNRVMLSADVDATTSEQVVIDFTSSLTGGRVYGIKREINYRNGNFGSLGELRAGIRQKYGEPTVVELAEHQNRIEVRYTYEKRPVRRFGEYDIRTRDGAWRINDCLNVSSHRITGSSNGLNPSPTREPCIGEISFTIFLGQNTQTVRRIEVEAVDFNRGAADVRLMQATLEKMLGDKVKSIVGKGTPRL